ncbi:MAG: APC family permease [Acidobacteria bacterium]|nr:APC family permease [Acidobacteriota bacterium]MCA1610477.1 APC family permease [Acidobacteriota bacterium]
MSSTPAADPKTGLLRAVSRWGIVALALNDVIGSGVYLSNPKEAAELLGAASIWAILAAGVAVLLLVLCFAEAGSLFDTPGSGYVYTRAAFGDFVGFEVGWMTWIARITSVAGLSVGFARVVGFLWEGSREGIGRTLMIVIPVLVLTAINVLGIRSGARTAVILTWGKILPLVLLVSVGIFFVSWGRVFPVPVPDPHRLGAAALVVLFAYSGFENTAAPAGEFKNPRRDVPFALITQILIVMAIYTLVQLVAIGLLPNLGASETPLADAARLILGPAGGLILTVGAALSVLGTNNNTILAGPRYLYALAETGRLPRVLARIHPKFRTPYVAIWTQTAIALPLALSGTFRQLVELSVIARLATYIGTAAAVPVLRRRMPATARSFRLPGGPLIPILALLMCFGFLSQATGRQLLAGALALAVGAIIYFARSGAATAVDPDV